jgi:hypothetical protein
MGGADEDWWMPEPDYEGHVAQRHERREQRERKWRDQSYAMEQYAPRQSHAWEQYAPRQSYAPQSYSPPRQQGSLPDLYKRRQLMALEAQQAIETTAERAHLIATLQWDLSNP